MSPEQKTAEIADTEEIVKDTEKAFLGLIEEIGIPSELTGALKTDVLPGMEIAFAESGPCLFQNVGYIENGIPDGRYRIILSKEILDSRASRLAGFVPEGQEYRLAVMWITGHELGHSLEAAYSLIHSTTQTEGIFAGLPLYKYPTNDYLDKFPEAKEAPNDIDADRIERERRAEGFGQEILVRELHKLGMDSQSITLSIHKLYEPMRERADAVKSMLDMTSEEVALADVYDGRIDHMVGKPLNPQFVKHELGYGYPMAVDEIARRYRAV